MSSADLLTLRQAAQRVGKSTRTLERWITAEKLVHAYKLPGPTGAYLFRPEDVDAAAEQVTA